MIGRNITNHSLEKKKSTLLQFTMYLVAKQLSFIASLPFRREMLLEFHRMKVQDELQPVQEDEYYVVEYQKAFYIGRILRNKNATLTIRFMHSVGAKVFDWPKRDNIDDCSPSWLIFGPLQIQGSGPFWFLQLDEVQHVYQYIKRSRKRWTLNYYCIKANIYRSLV